MGATFFAAIAAFAVGIICFSVIIYIIGVIGMFKVFEKFGLPVLLIGLSFRQYHIQEDL